MIAPGKLPPPYDSRRVDLALKAGEGMIAHAGLRFPMDAGQSADGLLKVAAHHRPGGGGYLTLTLFLDPGPGPAKDFPRARLDRLSEQAVLRRLGELCQGFVRINLSEGTSTSGDLLVEELNFYFQPLVGRERALLEQGLLPMLTLFLGCEFSPVEWWTEPAPGDLPLPQAAGVSALHRLFRRFAQRLPTP